MGGAEARSKTLHCVSSTRLDYGASPEECGLIQIAPGDLVCVESEGSFYYALILDRVGLFGGNWMFAFHEISKRPLEASELLGGDRSGFHAFVDFIWAKREGRISRMVRKADTGAFQGPGRLKSTHVYPPGEKAKIWFIYDMKFQELRRGPTLRAGEEKLPLFECINEALWLERVKERWTPEQDSRI